VSERPVLIVDALNVFTRHFVVNPSMSDQGHHVGGFMGFMKGLRLLCERIRPSKVVVVWEGGGAPRKTAIFKDYKQSRRPQRLNRFYSDIPDTIENRNRQVTLTVDALKNVPIVQMYVSDCEADDVIGYLVKYAFKDNGVVIASSDKDMYQLVNNRVTQWSPGQKKFIDTETIIDKLGIHPNNFCTARCFIGDPSDGLPGIKGAGFKTMAKRFPELRLEADVSVDDIIKKSQESILTSKVKVFQSIVDNSTVARRNWKVMFLGTSNLSGTQINKICGVINTFKPNRDKISLMRLLLREGINDFDVDTFYMTINSSYAG